MEPIGWRIGCLIRPRNREKGLIIPILIMKGSLPMMTCIWMDHFCIRTIKPCIKDNIRIIRDTEEESVPGRTVQCMKVNGSMTYPMAEAGIGWQMAIGTLVISARKLLREMED